MSTDEYVPSEAEMIAGLVQLPDEPAGLCRRVRPDEMKRGLARVRRDAAREALGSLQAFARDCMFNEELAAEDLAGWHHTWAAALSHRANHYPHPDDEETP